MCEMRINYLKGDATAPSVKGNKIIAHICNDLGGWGKGFVMEISKRWSEPETQYRDWHKNRNKNDFALGSVQFVQVEKYITVANMIGQRGIKTGSKGVPVRYEAVRDCLNTVAEKALEINASVHMPRIGCGLAGGKWEAVEPVIMEMLINKGIVVYVYDY